MTYDTDDGSNTPGVRPLDEHGLPIEVEPAVAPRQHSPWVVGGGVAAAVLLVGAAGAWFWWSNVVRGPLGAAEVIPASADIVLTVDALDLIQGDRVQRLVDAFAPDGDFDLADVLDEIDDATQDETGIRVFDEASEWVGRSAALAVWVDPVGVLEAGPTDVDVVAALMARDESAARDFFERVIAENAADGTVQTITIADVEVWHVDDDEPVFLAVHSGRVLISNDESRMEAMIEPGRSIVEDETFNRLWDASDAESALMTGYVSESLFDNLAEAVESAGLGDQLGVAGTPTAAMGTLRLDDDGVAMSLATISLDAVEEATGGVWARELPAGTYAYVSAGLPGDDTVRDAVDQQIDELRAQGMGPQIDEMLDGFEDVFGVSVVDFVGQFAGEILFAAIPTNRGPLPSLVSGPLGIGMSVGVEDESVITDALAVIPDLLGPDGRFITETLDGVWVIDGGDGALITYGVTNGRLFIAGDTDSVEAVTNGPGGITSDVEWRRLADLIGEDMVVYVNIGAIVETFAPADEADQLRPLRSFGVAGSQTDGIAIVQMRLVVDY